MIKRSLFVSASAFFALSLMAPMTTGLDLATVSEEEAFSEATTGCALANSLMALAQSECQTGRRSDCEKKLDDIKKECFGGSKRKYKRRRRR